MHLNENSCVSLYKQLKEIFIHKIKSSEWCVNSKIPAERRLCEMYNVSRITVRQALDELESEGYLYRKQGKGTFVTAPKLVQRLSNFYSFSDDIKSMGYTPSTKILCFKTINPGQNVSKHLSIPADSAVYSLKRLRLANGEPFAIETSYIPVRICPKMTKGMISSNGLYNALKNSYGIAPDEAEETFEAVLIEGENALYLDINKNAAGIYLERITRANNKTVEFCESIIRGDRYKYKVFLK